MTYPVLLPCDGCGQSATTEHLSQRLQRLEWSTRFRPLHIKALVLGGVSPKNEASFLYAPEGRFEGEAATLLEAAKISKEGKSRESALAEFQRRGLMLIHVLECPLDESVNQLRRGELMEKQLAATVARIRRSLKPKRVVLLGGELQPVLAKLQKADLGCPVLPASDKPFLSTVEMGEGEMVALWTAILGASCG